MTMRRILFVVGTVYLPVDVSGANVSLHALCRRLAARGLEAAVACVGDASRPEPTSDSAGTEYAVWRSPDPVAALPETVRRFAPDAIVLRAPSPAARAIQHAPALGQPLHCYFVSSFLDRSYPGLGPSPRLRYAANSPFLARLVEAYLGEPVTVVPPLIEFDEYRCETSGDAVLFVNPVAIKGVHLAAAIAERLPHRRFLFARSWPDHDRHSHLDVRLPNVELARGPQPMRALLARTRVVLMPTVCEESSGRILGEAQASGIPALTSDRGGLRESVGPGGLVLSLGEPLERWCEATEAIFADAGLFDQLSRGARAQAARPECQPERIVERFLAFVGA